MTDADRPIYPRAGAGQGGKASDGAQPHSAPPVPLCPAENIFGSSSSSHRLHRKRPLLSKQGSVATSFPVVEEANSEEKEAFFAFMEQLGASNSLPE